MKRNWDVVREVLLQVQDLSAAERRQFSYALADDAATEDEHAFLLYDAGFLKGVSADSMDGRELISPDLTWQGHDLLSTMKSPPVWERVKNMAAEKGLDLTFDVIKVLAAKALAQVIG